MRCRMFLSAAVALCGATHSAVGQAQDERAPIVRIKTGDLLADGVGSFDFASFFQSARISADGSRGAIVANIVVGDQPKGALIELREGAAKALMQTGQILEGFGPLGENWGVQAILDHRVSDFGNVANVIINGDGVAPSVNDNVVFGIDQFVLPNEPVYDVLFRLGDLAPNGEPSTGGNVRISQQIRIVEGFTLGFDPFVRIDPLPTDPPGGSEYAIFKGSPSHIGPPGTTASDVRVGRWPRGGTFEDVHNFRLNVGAETPGGEPLAYVLGLQVDKSGDEVDYLETVLAQTGDPILHPTQGDLKIGTFISSVQSYGDHVCFFSTHQRSGVPGDDGGGVSCSSDGGPLQSVLREGDDEILRIGRHYLNGVGELLANIEIEQDDQTIRTEIVKLSLTSVEPIEIVGADTPAPNNPAGSTLRVSSTAPLAFNDLGQAVFVADVIDADGFTVLGEMLVGFDGVGLVSLAQTGQEIDVSRDPDEEELASITSINWIAGGSTALESGTSLSNNGVVIAALGLDQPVGGGGVFTFQLGRDDGALEADLNGDFRVDGHDILVAQRFLGTLYGASVFDLVAQHYGKQIPIPAQPVPEPASSALLLLGLLTSVQRIVCHWLRQRLVQRYRDGCSISAQASPPLRGKSITTRQVHASTS